MAASDVVIVAYKPKPGKDADLLQLTREHLQVLRAEGLATDMPATVMMAADGTILEVFEWAPGGVEKAHSNAAVGALWARYWEACEVVPLKTLAEAADMFASFRRVEL
jgi:hypothetical protein